MSQISQDANSIFVVFLCCFDFKKLALLMLILKKYVLSSYSEIFVANSGRLHF